MRTLIILLFISFNSFGQTYDDIMSINDLNSFKRVMIENDFQLDSILPTDEKTTYLYRALTDDNGGYYSEYVDEGYFHFYFDKISDAGVEFTNTPYDKVFTEVKGKCTYVGIYNINNFEFAVYECDDAKDIGYVGFMINNGYGWIRRIPKKH